MRRIGKCVGPAVAAGVMLLVAGGGVRETPALAQGAVTVKVVSYDDLGKAIKQLKGKIVVVDFWGIT